MLSQLFFFSLSLSLLLETTTDAFCSTTAAVMQSASAFRGALWLHFPRILLLHPFRRFPLIPQHRAAGFAEASRPRFAFATHRKNKSALQSGHMIATLTPQMLWAAASCVPYSCTVLNDCCPDYSSVCADVPPSPPNPPPPPSPPPLPPIICADFCGGPSPYGCHCDSA